MGSTAVNGFPYPPETGVLPDVPYWLQQLAEAIEAKMPRGRIASAVIFAQRGPVASGAGYVGVAGLSATFTLATARKITALVFTQATSDKAGTVVGIRVKNTVNGGASGGQTTQIPIDNYGQPLPTIVADTLPAGTWTYQVELAQFGGPGGAFLTAQPATLLVIDDGPA